MLSHAGTMHRVCHHGCVLLPCWLCVCVVRVVVRVVVCVVVCVVVLRCGVVLVRRVVELHCVASSSVEAPWFRCGWVCISSRFIFLTFL